MPKSHHPIDSIMNYFETAPLAAVETALHLVRRVVRERLQVATTASAVRGEANMAPKAKAATKKNAPVKAKKVASAPAVETETESLATV